MTHSSQSIVELKHITYRQTTTVEQATVTKAILNDISWSVRRGQHWGILGNNGSGKTTLLNVINGYVWPTRGTVQVFGQRFGEVDLRALRTQIGWVSSAFSERVQAAHATDRALDVVASGKFASIGLYDTPTQRDVAKAGELLDAFGASQLAHRRFYTLSQGEKQRVLLARAWMADPRLLILDEPCTGLDIFAREQLLNAIDQLASSPQAPTLMYVTHHPEELLPLITHALLIRDGRVQSFGPKVEVLTDESLSEALAVPVQVRWDAGRPWVTVRP